MEQKILILKMFKSIGFEVVKSNSEQIAVNNKANEMPMVLNNDIGYLTPSPFKFFNIDKEIKRLKDKGV